VIGSPALREQIRQRLRVDSERKSVYNIKEYSQRELARIYSLSVRLISRLLVRSVREESNQVSAVRLWRAVRSAERLGITYVRVKRIY
jgi:hypothetical protein